MMKDSCDRHSSGDRDLQASGEPNRKKPNRRLKINFKELQPIFHSMLIGASKRKSTCDTAQPTTKRQRSVAVDTIPIAHDRNESSRIQARRDSEESEYLAVKFKEYADSIDRDLGSS